MNVLVPLIQISIYPRKGQVADLLFSTSDEKAKDANIGRQTANRQKLPMNRFRRNVNVGLRKRPPLIKTHIHIKFSMDPKPESGVDNIWCRVRFLDHCSSIVVSKLTFKVIFVRSIHSCK